ncbi:MAG: hypothetical protein IGS50_12515 [Synechococcales cyanobacterium C42_A2020_086]|jgi:hypothetical protein|nr:hypothetical protein [Synechococcales cyanobacterium C42_A2020_086]
MQVLDFAFEATAILGFGYVSLMFVSGLVRRWQRPAAPVVDSMPIVLRTVRRTIPVIPDGVFCCDADPADAAIVEAYLNRAASPVIADNVVPFHRPQRLQPFLNGLSIRELKRLASERRIPRYGVMTKAQLVAALSQSQSCLLAG